MVTAEEGRYACPFPQGKRTHGSLPSFSSPRVSSRVKFIQSSLYRHRRRVARDADNRTCIALATPCSIIDADHRAIEHSRVTPARDRFDVLPVGGFCHRAWRSVSAYLRSIPRALCCCQCGSGVTYYLHAERDTRVRNSGEHWQTWTDMSLRFGRQVLPRYGNLFLFFFFFFLSFPLINGSSTEAITPFRWGNTRGHF